MVEVALVASSCTRRKSTVTGGTFELKENNPKDAVSKERSQMQKNDGASAIEKASSSSKQNHSRAAIFCICVTSGNRQYYES